MHQGLFKTTIVVWSDFSPEDYDAEDICREAIRGDAHLSTMRSEFIDDPESDPDWDDNSFFEDDEEDDNGEAD